MLRHLTVAFDTQVTAVGARCAAFDTDECGFVTARARIEFDTCIIPPVLLIQQLYCCIVPGTTGLPRPPPTPRMPVTVKIGTTVS